jgi:hypothetical protein
MVGYSMSSCGAADGLENANQFAMFGGGGLVFSYPSFLCHVLRIRA